MIIVDAKMPKSCRTCTFSYYDGQLLRCPVIGRTTHSDVLPYNCPVKCELPERHGRLIDEDQITVEEDVYNQKYIIHAPTVVEAEYDLPQKPDRLKATWNYFEDKYGNTTEWGYRCSNCGFLYTDDEFQYCPGCGAQMTKEQEITPQPM